MYSYNCWIIFNLFHIHLFLLTSFTSLSLSLSLSLPSSVPVYLSFSVSLSLIILFIFYFYIIHYYWARFLSLSLSCIFSLGNIIRFVCEHFWTFILQRMQILFELIKALTSKLLLKIHNTHFSLNLKYRKAISSEGIISLAFNYEELKLIKVPTNTKFFVLIRLEHVGGRYRT